MQLEVSTCVSKREFASWGVVRGAKRAGNPVQYWELPFSVIAVGVEGGIGERRMRREGETKGK